MPVFLIKTILASIMLLLTANAMFTMLEILGRAEKKYNIEKLKKLHRANGALYILLFLVISYLCISFVANTKTEPSARVVFHSVFAIAVIVILLIKVLFVKSYRQFYGKVSAMGVTVAVLTFLMFGTSGGYYLLVAGRGLDKTAVKVEEAGQTAKTARKIALKTDTDSIKKGKELYDSKCYSCHDPHSTGTIIGPGHKGILKNQTLPTSKRAATPENIAIQLRIPYKDMPSFEYLSEKEIMEIVAYLNTL